VLAVGTALMISVNLVLLRRVFGPLEQFTALMRRIGPHAPGRRLSLDGQMPKWPTSVMSQLDARPPRARAAREQELAIFRVAQESLTNVARHAQARNVSLALNRDDAAVVLIVRDGGRGITEREANGRRMGLGGMH